MLGQSILPGGVQVYRLREKQARSNIAAILETASEEHPPLWRLIEDEMTRLEAEGNDVLHRKVRFVQEELRKRKGSVNVLEPR